MLKIWGSKGSSNVQKVLWACGEMGLAFEREEIGPRDGRHKSPAGFSKYYNYSSSIPQT